jgi:hypothetical protein
MILTQLPQQSLAPRTLNQGGGQAPQPNAPDPGGEGPKPSDVDNFSTGAASGANLANGLMGAWSGGVAGVVTGGAISLGAGAVSTAWGALSGSTPVTLSGLASTVGTAGLYALGGGVLGAGIGAVTTMAIGRGVGNFGAAVARKFDLNEEAGRAVGTLATSMALSGMVGLSVGGWSGATTALVLAGGFGAKNLFMPKQ